MFRPCVILLLAICAIFSSGCNATKGGLSKGNAKKNQGQEENQDVPRDTYVGVIESVNPEQQFVLVRIEQRVPISAGTQLETRTTSGLRARLVAGPERKLNFLAADIVDGLPHAGDVVVLPAGAPSGTAPPTLPPGTPGGEPATPGKFEPILTAEPPPGSLPQPGVYSSPMSPPPGGQTIPNPGVPDANLIPGVPPTGHPPSAPRTR